MSIVVNVSVVDFSHEDVPLNRFVGRLAHQMVAGEKKWGGWANQFDQMWNLSTPKVAFYLNILSNASKFPEDSAYK
jgi:hypothetical protein